jgi:hypothetical protein
MPAKSQAQQKFMGIVHAIQKGDAKASDFSKDAQDTAKEMKPSDAKDFASTKHAGLPKKVGKENVEQKLKEIIRQTYRESLRESVNESISHEAMGIASMTNTRKEAVQKFIDDNNLDAKEILTHVTKGKLPERIRFVQALVGTPNNSSFKWYVKNYANESVVTEGKKAFKINPPIGKAKYSISAHNGVSKHKDGSDFWDILIFKNKADLERRANYFRSEKYIEEAVVTEGRYDADLDKIEAVVKNATSFMNVGSELKKAGIKYDFTTSMIPMYMIKVSGNTIAVVNKKYAAGAEREVKDIAIGLLN